MALTPDQIEKAIDFLIRSTCYNTAAMQAMDVKKPDTDLACLLVDKVRQECGLKPTIGKRPDPSQN